MYKTVKCMMYDGCFIFEYLEELDIEKLQKFGATKLVILIKF